MVHEQISPNTPFIDYTPQQLERDEENDYTFEELNQSPF
jgi:hypothetical protein